MVENSLSPVTSLINYVLARFKLRNFSSADITGGFGGPGRISLTASYLKFLRWVEDISILRRRGEEKRFPKESSSLLQMHIPCFFSRVEKISLPIGLHGPPRRTFLGGISPPFH